ncbi:hypothetical protein [Absidia glauca]|uniref:RxLR effector protein n=1 Tax=Absidia glauca TaxID=4829 RepID=A0A168Q9Q9_ABSGL|nr:hypothetical protein [Absidia glauca]
MLPRFLTISAAVLIMASCTMANLLAPPEADVMRLSSRAIAEFKPAIVQKRAPGGVVDDGLDLEPEGGLTKRSFMANEKLASPGSSDFGSTGSIRKRHGEKGSHRNEHEEEERSEGEHDDHRGKKGSDRSEHAQEERGEGEHSDHREAKRGMKARRRLLAKRAMKARVFDKRDIDSMVTKSGMFVDSLIYKQDQINEKLSGDKPQPASTLPNGHNGKAGEAMGRAKSLSSSAAKGDIKAMGHGKRTLP